MEQTEVGYTAPMASEPASHPAAAELRIGDRVVHPSLNRIDGPDGSVQVERKVMEVLACLAARPGEVVSKEELVREVWQGRFVSDDVVWRSIAELRRALGDDPRKPAHIQTIPKRGYRLAPHPPSPSPVSPPSTGNGGNDKALRLIPRWWLGLALLAGFLLIAAIWAERRSIRPMSEAPTRVRLAVLPFQNLSSDPSQEWLSDGLTEELITRLGGLKPDRLGVIGRTSVMALKGRHEDLRTIARELDADYLLEGSVRREGERVRVTARLIQASDQTTIWSDRQDLSLWGTLHLQSRVAERVAEALALELLPAERSALGTASAANPQAHEAYLKGRDLLSRGMPDDLRRSVGAFEEAIALDPASAAARAGLADALHLLAIFGLRSPREAYPPAEAAARKALELDDSLADTHATLGSILFRYHRDGPAAEDEFRRALALNPSSATAHHDYAWFLLAQKRFEEALAEIRAAQDLEPLSIRANADVGWVYYRARRYPEAIHEMERTLAMEPRFLPARQCLERALARQGRLSEALAHAKAGARQEGMSPEDLEALPADPAAAIRKIGEWRLARLQARAEKGYVSPYALAAQHAELGDREQALTELEKAIEERDPSAASAEVDPAFDGVRTDPRFGRLMARIGLERMKPR